MEKSCSLLYFSDRTTDDTTTTSFAQFTFILPSVPSTGKLSPRFVPRISVAQKRLIRSGDKRVVVLGHTAVEEGVEDTTTGNIHGNDFVRKETLR